MMPFSRSLLAGFATMAALLLAACGDVPNGTSSPSGARDMSHLPTPGVWSDQRIYEYFEGSPREGFAHFHEHTVVGRLEEECGEITPLAPYGGRQHTRAIRFYERQIDALPEKAECWAENAERFALARDAELAHLLEVAPYAAALPRFEAPPRNGRPHDRTGPMHADMLLTEASWKHGLEKELDALARNMASFVSAPDRLRRSIAMERGWRNENRESWRRAATSALTSFANDNPFSRPNPGEGLSSMLTSDMLGVTDPAVVGALNAFDRSIMGENAFVRALTDRAARQGTASGSNGYGNYSNLPTPTLTATCTYGERPSGECLSLAELEAMDAAEREAMEAAKAARNAAALQRLERERAVAAQRARERTLARLRACGYESIEAYETSGATALCI